MNMQIQARSLSTPVQIKEQTIQGMRTRTRLH